jgi:hypothetical protein
MNTDIDAPPTWVSPTPDGWLAGSRVFPRIAVKAPTEVEAIALLAQRCAAWLALPDVQE